MVSNVDQSRTADSKLSTHTTSIENLKATPSVAPAYSDHESRQVAQLASIEKLLNSLHAAMVPRQSRWSATGQAHVRLRGVPLRSWAASVSATSSDSWQGLLCPFRSPHDRAFCRVAR